MVSIVVLLCRAHNKTRIRKQIRDERALRVGPHDPQKARKCRTHLGDDTVASMFPDEVVYCAQWCLV